MKIIPINETKKYWNKFNLTKNKKYNIWIDSEDKNCKLFLNDKSQPIGLTDMDLNTKYWQVLK